MVAKAFDQMTGAGGRFSGMVDKLSQTVAGRWSAVTESLDLFGQKMALAGFKSLDVAGTLHRIGEAVQSWNGKGMEDWLVRAGAAGKRITDLGEAMVKAGSLVAGDGVTFLPSLEGITLWVDNHGDEVVKMFAQVAVEIQIAAIRMGDLVRAASDFSATAKMFSGLLAVTGFTDRLHPMHQLKDRRDEFAQLRANADNAGGLFAQAKEERRLREHWKRVGERMRFMKDGGQDGAIKRFLAPEVEKAEKAWNDAMGFVADRLAPGWMSAAEKAAGAGQKLAGPFESFGDFKRRLDFGVLAGKLDGNDRDAALIGRFEAWKAGDASRRATVPTAPGAFFRTGSAEAQAARNAAIAADAVSKPGGESQADLFKRFREEEANEHRERMSLKWEILQAIREGEGVNGVRI